MGGFSVFHDQLGLHLANGKVALKLTSLPKMVCGCKEDIFRLMNTYSFFNMEILFPTFGNLFLKTPLNSYKVTLGIINFAILLSSYLLIYLKNYY